jgi:DNA polymerase V
MSRVTVFGPYPASLQPSPVQITLFDVRVPCGFPSPAQDYEEQPLDLNSFVVRNWAATFFFTVSGDSMTGAGINDGDRLAVDRSISPRHGHIVVAVVNQEYTVKRLHRLHGVLELRAEHPDYPPIGFKEEDELSVWGVVVAVIRKLPA